MDYRKEFVVKPGTKVKLNGIDPGYKGKHVDEKEAQADLEKYRAKLAEQQHLLLGHPGHAGLPKMTTPMPNKIAIPTYVADQKTASRDVGTCVSRT